MSRACFSVGSPVEVTSEEPGFEGSWYEATVAAVSRSPIRYVVVYDSLLDDAPGDTRPLREVTTRLHLRPRPPWAPGGDGWLCVGMLVEARHNDGWWVGRVEAVGEEQGTCVIWFPSSEERIVFRKCEVRRHMVWKRGRWLAPNPEKYESLPGWKINPSHLLQKPDIQKDPQASENKAESPIAVTTSVEKLNIAKGSLIVGQPTPDAALFNKPSNHCQFEPEVSSMNLLFNHDTTSAGEDDAIVTSDDGSPPKRNPKMRLLKSVVLKDFMMRMEQEIGKELQMGKEQKERSTIEALESARKVESLGKEPSSGKRLHSRVFDGTDENTLFSTDVVTSSCFSGDVQPSQVLAGTITPMLGDRKKIRPSSLSSIHNFRIRNVVEMSSAGPRSGSRESCRSDGKHCS